MMQVTTESLDSSQYTKEHINQYEQVFGEDFVSPGGIEMARELIGLLALKPGSHVVDVGCGLGGSAFLMAREFGFTVDGLDLSENMLAFASEKLNQYGLQEQIKLKKKDCLHLDSENLYDAVYSRDVFLHISDKACLFEKLFKVLNPGGVLLFTDYCRGVGETSKTFEQYVVQRGYTLHTIDDYAAFIHDAGFQHIQAIDKTDKFIGILKKEMSTIEYTDLSQTVIDALKQSWHTKYQRALSAEHCWGLFIARKPSF